MEEENRTRTCGGGSRRGRPDAVEHASDRVTDGGETKDKKKPRSVGSEILILRSTGTKDLFMSCRARFRIKSSILAYSN